jgi:hypothetical protein
MLEHTIYKCTVCLRYGFHGFSDEGCVDVRKTSCATRIISANASGRNHLRDSALKTD